MRRFLAGHAGRRPVEPRPRDDRAERLRAAAGASPGTPAPHRDRRRVDRPERLPVQRLLPVRLRRLDEGEPDPERPGRLGDRVRPRREQQGATEADPRARRREPPRGPALLQGARRLLRRVHGRGGGREGRPPRDRPRARADRAGERRDESLARGRPTALDRRLPVLRRGVGAGLQGRDRDDRAGRAARARPSGSRLLPEGRRAHRRDAAEVRRARRARLHAARRQARAREEGSAGGLRARALARHRPDESRSTSATRPRSTTA